MVGCSVDITERKRAEERIRELGAIVESSDDAIFGKTLDGTITSWNKGAEKIYGYAENEVIGQPISILVPADRRDEVPRILGRLARGEAIIREDRAPAQRWGRNLCIPDNLVLSETGKAESVGSSTVARDVTRRKRIERSVAAKRTTLCGLHG